MLFPVFRRGDAFAVFEYAAERQRVAITHLRRDFFDGESRLAQQALGCRKPDKQQILHRCYAGVFFEDMNEMELAQMDASGQLLQRDIRTVMRVYVLLRPVAYVRLHGVFNPNPMQAEYVIAKQCGDAGGNRLVVLLLLFKLADHNG